MLSRLLRWRIPGVLPETSFDELFRASPFLVLSEDQDHALVSGLVGRIWTLRRDYPELENPEEFLNWSKDGTARVVFANWVELTERGGSALNSETRVEAIGRQGRLGVTAVRPLVSTFHQLIGTEAITAAVRMAEDSEHRKRRAED